jgi:hypothetical protein
MPDASTTIFHFSMSFLKVPGKRLGRAAACLTTQFVHSLTPFKIAEAEAMTECVTRQPSWRTPSGFLMVKPSIVRIMSPPLLEDELVIPKIGPTPDRGHRFRNRHLRLGVA